MESQLLHFAFLPSPRCCKYPLERFGSYHNFLQQILIEYELNKADDLERKTMSFKICVQNIVISKKVPAIICNYFTYHIYQIQVPLDHNI